jgi:hypothetical protein
VRDFVQFSGRGTVREMPTFVGSPKMVAHREYEGETLRENLGLSKPLARPE